MSNYNVVFLEAEKLGINRKAAARMRIRYLKPHLNVCLQQWARTGDQVAMLWALETLSEITYLMARSKRAHHESRGRISQGTIEMAKSVPITTVIDFGRNGKAYAFCHEDKRPSLCHANKTNTAWCPVCDKRFNPIEVLMQRDGMGFVDAVRCLT